MRLEKTSLDTNSIRDKARRAYLQIQHERELLIARMEDEILGTGRSLTWISSHLGFMRKNPRGNRRSLNSLGELQGNMARINTISGAIQIIDQCLELWEDVLGIPEPERYRPEA